MKYKIIDYPSPNFDDRPSNLITHLILHYTSLNLADSLKALTGVNPEGKHVSAHYLLPDQEKNIVYRLVPEEKSAQHAGVSYWQGQEKINGSSIGIEIVNLGSEPYPEAQIETLIALCQDIIARYNIHPTCIIGHSDIAMPAGRKIDPGPLFPWKKLYDHGIGAWYDQTSNTNNINDIAEIQQQLCLYGYGIRVTGKWDEPSQKTMSMFQMHFRPSDYSGTPDAETVSILENLNKKYSRNI